MSARHFSFFEMPVASPLSNKVNELIRVEIELAINGKEVVHVHLVMNDGTSGAERNAVTAEIAVLLSGIDAHLLALHGKTSDASDRTQSAVVALVAIDRYPAHDFHLYSMSARLDSWHHCAVSTRRITNPSFESTWQHADGILASLAPADRHPSTRKSPDTARPGCEAQRRC
jgi:hypothetical protein